MQVQSTELTQPMKLAPERYHSPPAHLGDKIREDDNYIYIYIYIYNLAF